MKKSKLKECIFDAVRAKRVLKTGYVDRIGGLYPSECDTVASHSNCVSVLALSIYFELKTEIEQILGQKIRVDRLATMAIFHDYGEINSKDTGAQSKALYPADHCKLHYLEREGLETATSELLIKDLVLELFDEYRKYESPESIIVHIADNLEGFEKAIHSSKGQIKDMISMGIKSINENIEIYLNRRYLGNEFHSFCELMVNSILKPGCQLIMEAYDIKHII